MTPEKLHSNPEEEPSYLEIYMPTLEELETLPYEELHELWRKNHEILKKLLPENNPPYFGLHGTSQDNFKQIEQIGWCYIEMATFYEKEYESEQFLYKLYAAALYVSAYANRYQPGQVMVFDCEQDRENVTYPWERLKPGGEFFLGLACDSDKEHTHFTNLRKQLKEAPTECDLLFRTDHTFHPQDFNERFKGTVNFSDEKFRKYFSKIMDTARIIFRERFLSQEIVAEILKLVSKKQSE